MRRRAILLLEAERAKVSIDELEGSVLRLVRHAENGYLAARAALAPYEGGLALAVGALACFYGANFKCAAAAFARGERALFPRDAVRRGEAARARPPLSLLSPSGTRSCSGRASA